LSAIGEEAVSEYPQKDFYRLNEVCQYTDTQPYVLRFWESEFPQLGPGADGRRVYRKSDIDLVRRIKQLLYEEECTLDEARRRIESEQSDGPPRGAAPPARVVEREAGPRAVEKPSRELAAQRIASALPPRQLPPPPTAHADPELIPRKRYDDAVEEIDHLRAQLRESERQRRKTEQALEEAGGDLARSEERSTRAIERLERLLADLG
jgi:DNA-binding transcriptional MerR regulator